MEKIIDVYYAKDNLPYKDEARTIHFPVAGSEFLGASQTTTIRFHYEQIGTDENVYTVESKRPDGKTGSQLLSKNTTEHYAEMSLSGWYSECKGDLFLSLKVYRGGTTATYNETTQLWEVSGVPVIESTGAIKLAINYTPMGRYENYNDAISTYQDVLAALGDKLDTIKGIVGVSGLSQVDTTEYDEGQLFFDVDTKNIYKLESGEFVKINNKLEIVDVSGYEYEELFEMFGTQPFMSYFEETTNLAVYQFKQNGNDLGGYSLYVWTYKDGCLYMPHVDMSAIFSIDDFTNLEYEKAPVITISSASGTLSDLDYEKVLQPNATIKYRDNIYTRTNEDEDYVYFAKINVDIDTTQRVTRIGKSVITLTKSTQTLSNSFNTDSFYDTVEINRLLSQKQDKLVSGTNIKTINNISLLGSGNIEIQGGSGDAEWGSIGGNIADQTDLQNEFQEVREIATGRTRSAIISYLKEAPTEQTFSQRPFYDLRGNRIETWSDFVAFVNGRTFANSKFNSQSDDIEIDYDEYIIFNYHTSQIVYRGDEAYEVDTSSGCLNEGDIIIVKETTDQQGETIPDRWVYISDQTLVCSKLETSKVNLDNYSTKTETSTEVNKVAHDIATEYDENTLYGSGDLCIKDKLLYKCNTDNTTGTWDSTKWDLTTVNSELGIIKGDIQHIANKFVGAYIGDETLFSTDMQVGDIVVENTGGQFLINEITFTGTVLSKVVLVGLEDNGNPVVHKFENGSWSSSNYVDTQLATKANIQQLGFIDYGEIDASTPQTIIDAINVNGGKFKIGNDTIYRLARTSRTNADGTISFKIVTTGQGGNLVIGLGYFNSDHSAYVFNRTIWSGVAHSNILDLLSTYNITVLNNITDGTNSVTVADLANLIAYAKAQGWIS